MTEQMNVPMLRFGEFTAEHIDTTLEELTKKKISYGIVQAGPHIPNGMPYIKSANLNKELCLDDLERTSDEIAKSYQRSEVSPEDIVFSLRGNIGLTRIVPASIPVANLTQGTARLSTKDSFSNVYVNYCLSTRRVYKRVNSVSKGSTFQEISLADLRNVKVTHSADLKEQQKIASFLSKVDEKIGLLSEKKDKLTEYKHGVMQQLFNCKWYEQGGQLIFTPPTLRFKADDGSEFPDWEEKTLGDLGQFKNGLNKGKEDFGFGKPFVNLQDVFGQQTLGTPNNFGLVNANDKDIKTYQLLKGDVIFIRSSVKKSGVGETALVSEDLVDTVYSGFLIRFRSKPCLIDGFKKYCFWDQKFRNRLITLSTTSANTNINQESLSQLAIQYPSQEEQTKIAKFLSAIDQKIELANTELDKAKEWKKGLLQQMFV